jgi:hypothetical protein
MPKLVLHIGTHKTGTTSIQQAMARQRAELRRDGIYYPDSSRALGGTTEAHHPFAHALTGTDRSALRKARRFARSLRREAKGDETVVLSAEPIWRHVYGAEKWTRLAQDDPTDYWDRRRTYLETLRDVLGAFDVEVVVVLRRQDRFVESNYSEMVARRMVQAPFHRWREKQRPVVDYSSQLLVLESVFDTVTVLRYEDCGGRAETAIFRHLGATDPPPEVTTRRSPDARVLLWMRLAKPGNWRKRRAFADSSEATGLFDDYGSATLWSSLEERLAYVESFGGPYGHTFFSPPTTNGVTASLTDASAGAIADAWRRWRQRQEQD